MQIPLIPFVAITIEFLLLEVRSRVFVHILEKNVVSMQKETVLALSPSLLMQETESMSTRPKSF